MVALIRAFRFVFFSFRAMDRSSQFDWVRRFLLGFRLRFFGFQQLE